MKTLKISAILHGRQNLVPGSSQHNGGARSNTAFTGSSENILRHFAIIELLRPRFDASDFSSRGALQRAAESQEIISVMFPNYLQKI